MTDEAPGGPTVPSAAVPLPVIAIVGRPNAGKSTLFNRIARTQKAQVDATPGITRDRNFAEARHEGRRFVVVDTGGLDLDSAERMAAEIRTQSDVAIGEADAVIFLLDGRAGLSPGDKDVVEHLRRSGRPLWLAVNKLDVPQLDADAADFFALGLDNVVPISAAHGRGVGELLDAVLDSVGSPRGLSSVAPPGAIAVAIVGRPNVGKSSLLNRLVGYERSIVTPVAGTTRDAIDTPLSVGDRSYVLVDTAGMRRKARIHERVEHGSVQRALRALERADVAVVVLEAAVGMTDQDARLAGYAWEKGKGLVLVANKCDLLEARRGVEAQVEGVIRRQYKSFDAVPIHFVSAQTGRGVGGILSIVDAVSASHSRSLPTPQLNQVMQRATRATVAPSVKGRRPSFKYAVQTRTRPPTVTFFCSHPDLVPESYTRFLVHRLREAFDLSGTPVRIQYRHGSVARE